MTGSRCVLDTSIIIDAFKRDEIADRLDSFSETFVSSTAVGELYYGVYRSQNIEKHIAQVQNFLQKCTVLEQDSDTANIYGRIKTALTKKGRPIPENDMWIAATAIQFNLPLLSADKHFKEVADLILISL